MKRAISLMLMFAIILSCLSGIASAAFKQEVMKKYTVGEYEVGKITELEPTRIYEFNLSSSGKINIAYSAIIKRSSLTIYDASEKEVWSYDPWSDSSSQQISINEEVYLVAGKYYFSVAKNNGFGDFNFRINFTASGETFADSQTSGNNILTDAKAISFGKVYKGQIATNDHTDLYKFSLSKAAKLKVNYTSEISASAIKVLDATGKEAWTKTANLETGKPNVNCIDEMHLTSGDYYISVTKVTGDGNYNFRIDSSAVNETFVEKQGGTNNTIQNAELAGINLQYTGQLAVNDEVDVYKFSLATAKKVKIALTSAMSGVSIKVTDAAGKVFWQATPKNGGTQISYVEQKDLAAGTYYLHIGKSIGYGNYIFFVSDGGKVTAVKDPITVTLNGERIQFDQLPIIENGSTLVPVRAIFEALKATVSWDGATQTITSQKGNISIKMVIGNRTMYKNGNPITLNTPPRIINTRTLVPVRAIAEAYGCSVNWDGTTRTVIIKSV